MGDLLTAGVGRWQGRPGESLTAVSQTGWTAPDSGILDGHPVDPDLRKQTPAH
jgi:hypothetical protein